MPSSSASASTSTQALLDAERGLNLLLNDDLNGARSTLESQKESPYALAGLGIVAFLTAAIGLEEDRLQSSSNTLALAENAAKKRKTSSSTGISDPGQWWTQSGTEYDVLLADVVAAQSVLHLLGDSYVEYAKAVYKLNTSFKYFTTIYKTVFPQDVKSDATVSTMIAELNERYRAATISHSLHSQKSTSTFGRLKSLSLYSSSKATSSTPDLSGPVVNGQLKGTSTAGHSVPGSVNTSRGTSIAGSPPEGALVDANGFPIPLWNRSPTMSFIVSGGAFGHGLFELIFALLPPKARKMFSWLGYGSGDRKKALKLLEMTARTGTDIHASFAGLTLISYYCFILVFSGWQCDRASLFSSCNSVLERELSKHPKGTLWILNKAKLLRYNGQVDEAANVLETALTTPSTFRQAVSTLQFELSWVLLAQGKNAEAANSFMKMIGLNSWSHSTYYALAAGCLHEMEGRTPEQDKQLIDMYTKLPTTFSRNKKFMGHPPSSEIYLDKRLKFYTAKTERWIQQGRLPAGSEWWESVAISMTTELSLYWNQYTHYPKNSSKKTVTRLEKMLAIEKPSMQFLDTPEEVALCQVVLGTCYTALEDYGNAWANLEAAELAYTENKLGEAYTYVGALSKLYLATLECREADSHQQSEKAVDKTYWKSKLSSAETKLDEMFALTGFDMNGRVESRGQMLRVEISEKKARLGL